MSGIICDNHENFGGNIALELDGIVAEVMSPAALEIPSFETLGRYWCAMNGRFAGFRRVFPGGVITKIGCWTQNQIPELPVANDRIYLMEARDGTNAMRFRVAVTTDGNLQLVNDAGTVVAATSAQIGRAHV